LRVTGALASHAGAWNKDPPAPTFFVFRLFSRLSL
jgi:hypothetical protein